MFYEFFGTMDILTFTEKQISKKKKCVKVEFDFSPADKNSTVQQYGEIYLVDARNSDSLQEGGRQQRIPNQLI